MVHKGESGTVGPRDAFVAELSEVKAVKVELAAIDQHPINAEYHQAVIDAAKPLYKRAPKGLTFEKASAKLPDAVRETIKAPFQARATALYNGLCDRKKKHDARLAELAAELTPERGDLEVEVYSVYAGSYRSAGDRYGAGAAELRAEEIRDLGVDARVESSEATHKVLVKVATDVDGEIVKRRGCWTEREWVRRCWKAGLNPRVFNPFLPHGFEEKHGLDFFGNDKKAVGK